MDDKKLLLKKMASWTITIFAAVFSVVMAVMWLVTYPRFTGNPLKVLEAAFGEVWYVILVAAGLCILAYFGYTLYLKKK